MAFKEEGEDEKCYRTDHYSAQELPNDVGLTESFEEISKDNGRRDDDDDVDEDEHEFTRVGENLVHLRVWVDDHLIVSMTKSKDLKSRKSCP